jgi:polysulfide reductase chain C
VCCSGRRLTPLRFWRILFSSTWKTSWIVRGIWSINLFVLFGGIYLGLAVAAVDVPLLLVCASVFALCSIIYFGFLLSYVKGLALWNNGLLPILILVISLWGGLNVFVLTSLVSGGEVGDVGWVSAIFPPLVIFTLFFYLMGVRYRGPSGEVSFGEIVMKTGAPLFWLGVVLLGFVFPMTVKLIDRFALSVPSVLLGMCVLGELCANLSLRYCLFKCALYEPVVPTTD